MSDLIKFLRTSTSSAYNKVAADCIEDLEARNKELTLQLLATSGQAADALDKLTKAVEERDEYKAAAEICGKAARAMLAELEGM